MSFSDCAWTGTADCGPNGNCGDDGNGASVCDCNPGYSGNACGTTETGINLITT